MQLEKWSVQIEELVTMINPTVSVLQLKEQQQRTIKEKSNNFIQIISTKIVCFKIVKLLYNKIIYTKTF